VGTLGTLAVSIIGDPRDLEKTFDGVTKKANALGQNMQTMGKRVSGAGKALLPLTGIIVGVGAGMFALAAKTGEYADRVLDLTEITGMSTDAIQEWQHVAKIAGVETEAVTKATEGLVRRLPQLEAEGGRATEQLDKLGLSFADLQAMSPDQMVDTLITKLSEMDDPLERNAVGAQLFGGAWKDIAPILGMGADAIADARKEAHDLGAVMGEDALNDANNFRIEMEKLKTEFGALGRGLATDLIPILMELMPVIRDSIIPAIRSFAEFIGNVVQAYGKLDPGLQKFILAGIALAAALGPVLIVVGKVITAIGVVIPIVAKVGAVFAAVAAGPAVLIVAAIAAIIAIGILLWKNFDQIQAALQKIWANITAAFSTARDGIGRIIDGIIGFFVSIPGRIKQALAGVYDAFMAPFHRIRDGIGTVTSGIRNTLNRINPFARQSPSLVEQVTRGTEQMLRDFKRLETELNIAPLAHTVRETERGTIHHSFDPIVIKGVNDEGQLVGTARMIMPQFARAIKDGNRRYAARTSLSPLSR